MLGDCVKELRFIGEDPDPQNMVCNGHHCSECEWESVNHCRDNLSFVPKQSSCPCEDGIDPKACAGCPQDEARKQTFRPFKDCDELVKYWTEKYQSVARPANTMPLIWVRKKEGGSTFLITGFDNGDGGWGSCVFLEDVWIDLKELFDDYEFLDGAVCGVKND